MWTATSVIVNVAIIATCVFILHRYRNALKELDEKRTEIAKFLCLTTATLGKYDIDECDGMCSIVYRVKGIDRVTYIKFFCSDDPEYDRMRAEELLEKLNE